MSKTIGRASLESDEEGLVTLQCDRCKSRFKMECSYLNGLFLGIQPLWNGILSVIMRTMWMVLME